MSISEYTTHEIMEHLRGAEEQLRGQLFELEAQKNSVALSEKLLAGIKAEIECRLKPGVFGELLRRLRPQLEHDALLIRGYTTREIMEHLRGAEERLRSQTVKLEARKRNVMISENLLAEIKTEIERRLKAAENWCGICGINCPSDHK